MFKRSTGDASDARRQDSPGLLRAKQLEWIVSFSVLLSEKSSDAPDAHLRALMKDWSRALDDLASRQYRMGIERIPIAEGCGDSARGYPAYRGGIETLVIRRVRSKEIDFEIMARFAWECFQSALRALQCAMKERDSYRFPLLREAVRILARASSMLGWYQAMSDNPDALILIPWTMPRTTADGIVASEMAEPNEFMPAELLFTIVPGELNVHLIYRDVELEGTVGTLVPIKSAEAEEYIAAAVSSFSSELSLNKLHHGSNSMPD